AQFRAEVQVTKAAAELTKSQLDAAQRELDILAVPQLRRPTRRMNWFQKSWEHLRSLRGGSTSRDPQLQGQAAAALEGIDARVIQTIPEAAVSLQFDLSSNPLLVVRKGKDEKGKPSFRTTLGDLTTDRNLVER